MSDQKREKAFGLHEPPRVFCWATLTVDEAAAQHAALAHWVDWLRGRYLLDPRTVPDCWDHHSDLVEELSALQMAWQHAYNGGARADAPLTWHTQLHTARPRLADAVAMTGCRPGHHRGPVDR